MNKYKDVLCIASGLFTIILSVFILFMVSQARDMRAEIQTLKTTVDDLEKQNAEDVEKHLKEKDKCIRHMDIVLKSWKSCQQSRITEEEVAERLKVLDGKAR